MNRIMDCRRRNRKNTRRGKSRTAGGHGEKPSFFEYVFFSAFSVFSLISASFFSFLLPWAKRGVPAWLLVAGLGLSAFSLRGVQYQVLAPTWVGDPVALEFLEEPLQAALEATAEFGPWPATPWRVQLHAEALSFEQATGAPPQRAACWIGSTLHLRPWEQLRRRELGALLRHELVHRRLSQAHLRRWDEEARCLWAETHVHPPEAWSTPPEEAVQAELDLALARGKTEFQAWAYRWIRAWLEKRPLPAPPETAQAAAQTWEPAEEGEVITPIPNSVRVLWPEARMPIRLTVNGRELPRKHVARWTFSGHVRFGPECPVRTLQGRIEARWSGTGWSLGWETDPETWVAAAVAGEQGPAPLEAQRALAAVLKRWLAGHPSQHPDGSLCPLTHCAVVRGLPGAQERKAARSAPDLQLDPRWAFFTASSGGISYSPREVWGKGPATKGQATAVPGDRWASWERVLTPEQVHRLKTDVRPGLAPGQLGLRIGASGPYPVEDLRLAAGRAFGWTTWPSNACQAELQADGSLKVRGQGWGHNVGLCLAWAAEQAKQGRKAEEILTLAFPKG